MLFRSAMCLSIFLCSLAAAESPPAALTPEQVAIEKQALQTGSLIRCPVCQGMPIAESPSDMAVDMMGQVRKMHFEGKTQEEIIQYFESRYGEFVRLKPKTQGLNMLVWLLPPLGILFSIFWVMRNARKMAARGDSQEKTNQDNSKPSRGENPYLDAVRDEVDQ